MARKSIDLIEHCQRVLAAIHPTTVRGVAYRLFARGLIDNMGGKSVRNVSRMIVIARERGIIPWEWIVDETRQEERVSSWNGLGDFGETVVRGYRKDFWQHQDSWIKVFSEKATVGGVVRPVLDEFAVSLPKTLSRGFNSKNKAAHNFASSKLGPTRTKPAQSFSKCAVSKMARLARTGNQ